MTSCAAVTLYQECCAVYGVKPNSDIIQQIDKPAFLLLRHIDASRTFLGELGVKALLEFVDQHASIQRLVLVKNAVDAACVEQLCHILRDGHPCLSYIDLSENAMSTPSARLLWETAREVPTLREVKLEQCGITQDWLNRVERCCTFNDELQRLGFLRFGPERSLRAWVTAFVLVLGHPKDTERYCTEILPPVSGFLSRLRVRIAPLTIESTDTSDVITGKISRCGEQYNYSLSWCVALINTLEKWSGSALSALMAILQEENPVMPPLRNKLGALRDPIQRCAPHLFVYDMTHLIKPLDKVEGSQSILPSEWLRKVGLEVKEGSKHPSAALLKSESEFHVRCQTDLYNSLHTIFSEPPRPMTPLSSIQNDVDEQMLELIGREKHLGSLNPKSKDVAQYIDSSATCVSVPLLVYGAGGLGKSSILSWVAATYTDLGSYKVIPYRVSHENQSLIAFLFHILRVFDKDAGHSFASVEELAMTVRKTICDFKGSPILLLVSCLDFLDSCGSRQSLSLEWLPSSLPSSVKIVVTLNTESPLLGVLRKRLPQPYEVLITPLPKPVRAELFLTELRRQGLIEEKKSGTLSTTSDSRILEVSNKALETVFLQKDGSENTVFAKYATAFLHNYMTKDMGEQDLALLVAEEVPDTVHDILVLLLSRYESLYGLVTVQSVLLSLVASPLPLPELVYICEFLGPCPRNMTVPLLLMMSDDGIVSFSQDSVVHLSNNAVRRVVSSLYEGEQDSVSVLVETHLYRLVKTESPDMSFCFKHLIHLMIGNGNIETAVKLLLNTTVMDALLCRSTSNQIYVIDALFRLLNAYELMIELGEGLPSQGGEDGLCLNRGVLRRALRYVQSYSGFFFQNALLASDALQYHLAAIEAREVPYTVLVPLNRGNQESATHSLQCKQRPVHFHLKGGYLAVASAQDVEVYSTSNFNKVLAHSSMPFELNQNLRGVFIATGTRVVAISDEQILLWDFAGHSFVLLNDTTASLSPNILDAFGVNIVVRHPSCGSLSIVDVSKKKVTSELPTLDAPIREAMFCGSGILVVALYDVFLIQDMDVKKLTHNGIIRCVNFSGDGQLIASCVKDNIWIWSGSGQLLHIIDAGLTPLDDLQFNPSGSLLLTRQSEGLKLWNSVLGRCITTLDMCFPDEISFACFAEDGSHVIGRSGTYICFWDGQSPYKPLGGFTCNSGHFTLLQEHNKTIVSSTSKNEMKIWQLGDKSPPSIQAAREKTLTTEWHKSAKLSYAPIIWVDVNTAGTLFTAVDAKGGLFLVSMESGKVDNLGSIGAYRAVLIAETIVVTSKGNGNSFHFRGLHASDLTSEVVLPKDAQAEAVLDIVKSGFDNMVAIISNAGNWSKIYIYNLPDGTLLNQFIGHADRITYASFCGDFLLSSGEDRTLRLWNLSRHAERTSYLHNCSIDAVTSCASSMSLFFLDEGSHLFHVHVEDMASSTNAHFVLREVEWTMLIPPGVRARQMAYSSDIILLTAENGSVYVVDLRHGGSMNILPDYKCLYVTATSDASDVFVMTCHTTGEVVSHQVRFAE